MIASRLFIAGGGVQSGDWPRIGYEAITPDEHLSESCFIMGLPPHQQVRRLKDNDVVRTPTKEDSAQLPHATVHNQYHFEAMLTRTDSGR